MASGEETALSCPICSAGRGRAVWREIGIQLLRCPGCRHVWSDYQQPGPGDHYWGDARPAVDGAQERYWYHARRPCYRQFLRRFASMRGHVVDVGAGLGFFVKEALEAGWRAEGWEMSPGAVAWGRGQIGISALHAGRVEEAGLAPGSVDAITLWDVIEHLPDPVSLLRWAHETLRPGGLLFLQTPNVDFQLVRARLQRRLRGLSEEVSLLEASEHLNDFSVRSMRAALAKAGFERSRFLVMLPTLSLAGGSGRVGAAAKLGWWGVAAAVHAVSGGRANLSNTLHVAAWR